MNEGEFRAKLNELGTSYQLAIARMNAVDSPGLKNRHRLAASAVIDAIQALERRHKVEGDGALGRALWEGKRQVESFKLRSNDLMIVENPEITYHDDLDTEVIETWSGQQFTRSVKDPEPATPISPWIEHHDRLIKEWFDGERALIDDLYSDVPKRIAKAEKLPTPRYPTLSRWGNDLVEIAKVLGGVVLVTAFVVWANWILQIFAWH